MLSREQFLKSLRRALNHLYNLETLRRSPLVTLLGVAERFDAPSALQRILTEAIESLEPEADTPPQSQAWAIYEPLFYRYVQQLSQKEIADQLGICERHVRRKQRAALEALAYQLWERFNLEARVNEDADAGTKGAARQMDVDQELAWLKDTCPAIPTDLNQTLLATLDRARPLAARYGVRLEAAVDKLMADALPSLAVHPVALSQTLLNLLGVAIHRAAAIQRRGAETGTVCVSARPLPQEIEIQVRDTSTTNSALSRLGTEFVAKFVVTERSAGSIPLENAAQPLERPARPDAQDDAASLDMARRLTELCGGKLTLSGDAQAEMRCFCATLTFPLPEQLPVLAIDDNADTLQLLQRYVLDTRYRLVGTRDPEQALHLAERLAPQAIVLDVMMPQVDGWEVLARLRQHPLTAHIPIVVCTILAQEELALSLGANAFLRKPVTRQDFLAVLERHVLKQQRSRGALNRQPQAG